MLLFNFLKFKNFDFILSKILILAKYFKNLHRICRTKQKIIHYLNYNKIIIIT